jgi:probable rRNA maturation factor
VRRDVGKASAVNGPSLSLAVQYAVPRRGVPARARLERWLLAALSRSAAVTVRFVGAREGRALNRRFREKDYATNVLTFVYDDRPRRPLAGDLVLCAPVVASEAREQGKALDAHYAHLVVHGALHLAGHEHKSEREATKMEALERRILARLGYADPYAREGRDAKRQPCSRGPET